MKKISNRSHIIVKPNVPGNTSRVPGRHLLRSCDTMSQIVSESTINAAMQHRHHENRNIMLYWDESPPPSSISGVLKKWQSVCPGWNVTLYNFETASRFLYENFGIEILRIFSQCAIPAMKSDFFRVLWAASEGGLYSDVTFIPKKEPFFIDENKNVTRLALNSQHLINGIFFARRNCFEIKLVAYEMIKRISIKRRKNIALVTGQGMWAKAIGTNETNTIAIQSYWDVMKNFLDESRYPESTRNTENHWSNIQKHQSIYCKPHIDKTILNQPANR